MSIFANVVPQATSSNMNSSYLRSNFIPTQQITIDNEQVQVLDILSPQYLTVLKRISSVKSFVFRTGMQITTLSYNYVDNTSAWWMFIFLNGYIHPLQMQEGDTVYVPNIQAAVNPNSTQTAAVTPSTVVF